ncbi:hypothetical protein PAXRUDRAFT_137252 [Paxillus rubicundulus Ve08.2h10]|uniref:F-box domain-containing protein n=1 Tax=Paxillus rubicundulus Ve08.2h10 TaxID=930991 RepID=A0A0D0DTA2_9AGAM|nr:hypothetical protein PAXRUDRAFT_137252 [Paxillus rubicundulus Ve08.2h10]
MPVHAIPPPHSEPLPLLPTTHRVLFIPELVDIIFRFLDKKTNVTNALVCKQWSQIALDVVWKEVDDLVQLFSLLKPIREAERQGERMQYVFEATPEANDWLRFERYASRVRCLRFHWSKYGADINRLLDDVARTRTSLEILPNMHTLEWIYLRDDHMERCKLFLHRQLRHLTVTAPCKYRPRPDFYTDLCARASQLHTLNLFIRYPGEPQEVELRILVSNLPELRRIVLPEFHFTSSLIEELSRAKNIGVVELSHDMDAGHGDPKNVETFAPVLAEGAFPSLYDLSLVAKIDDIDRFFQSNFAPINITTLYINTYEDHSPSEVHDFLVTLSQQCQLLSKLYIQLLHKEHPLSDLVPENQLSYESIKPLLAFPNLATFELMHKYPLKITLDEIEEFASRWPSLESLMLNAEPLVLDEDKFTLDLRALLPFARYCPSLRKLGLYINATEAEIPSVQSSIEAFHSLRVLSLGTSQVRDQGTVAAFLSRVCPPGCLLEVGITWEGFGPFENRILGDDLRSELHERGISWKAVGELLPVLIQLRREERERSRALREEVEDLRIRNRLLMDKGAVKTSDSCVVA